MTKTPVAGYIKYTSVCYMCVCVCVHNEREQGISWLIGQWRDRAPFIREQEQHNNRDPEKNRLHQSK